MIVNSCKLARPRDKFDVMEEITMKKFAIKNSNSKNHAIPPDDRRWAPGYYRIDRVGGRDAALGPNDLDWWFCRITDCPGGWGIGDLLSHDRGGRPYGVINGRGRGEPRNYGDLPGSGERYLDRMEASPHFTVTRVDITESQRRRWQKQRDKADGPNGLGSWGRVDTNG